jgi:hypothetical protein
MTGSERKRRWRLTHPERDKAIQRGVNQRYKASVGGLTAQFKAELTHSLKQKEARLCDGVV